MRFAICNELFDGWSFEAVCSEVVSFGYTGIEIAPYTLGKPITQVSGTERSAIRNIADRYGVEIVGFHWLFAKTNGFHINSPNPQTRDKTKKYLIELGDLCADFGGKILVFGSPNHRNVLEGIDKRDAWMWAVEVFQDVSEYLAKIDVTLCIEPLSTLETNFINTAAEGAKMVTDVGSTAFRMILDVKAMSSEDISIPELIFRYSDILRHFHANDANLRGPGFGNTDYRPIFAALREVCFKDWVSVEVFDSNPDPETIARKSIEYMKKIITS